MARETCGTCKYNTIIEHCEQLERELIRNGHSRYTEGTRVDLEIEGRVIGEYKCETYIQKQ